ncbi:hypothetical protein D9M68_533400 [compost metagenome]
MPKDQLIMLLRDAAEMGAVNALSRAGILKPHMSIAEAKRMYGVRTVDRWIKEGKVKLRLSSPNATKRHIVRSEIEAVAKAVNRPIYSMITTR